MCLVVHGDVLAVHHLERDLVDVDRMGVGRRVDAPDYVKALSAPATEGAHSTEHRV
jgi:hypothetical protein